MRTLNYVVLVLVLVSFGFVSFGCGDDSPSPVAPSSTPVAEAPSYAPMGSQSVRPVSYSPDVDTVAPGDARYGPNAYDFYAHMDSGMLHVALVEDAMATMRKASQPHRMRQVEVYHVTSEPRQDHVGRVNGPALYSGTVQLAGQLELPPIEIEGCAPHEWIVVTAAELSDDRYDGWRNAPCPQPDGVVVGSDGTGPGWDRSEHGAPSRDFPPEPEPQPEADPTPAPMPDPTPAPTPAPGHAQRVVDREIEADPLRQRGDYVQFPVRNLFQNPVGTNSYHFPVRSSDESVATARIVTDNPEIRITVTGFGTTTISVRDTRADVSVSFVVSVMPEPTPTPTPMPMPMPEPTPNPVLPGTLPVSFTDPTDDIEWFDDAPSGGRSRLSTDLIRMELSDQDSEGWIRVTFTLAARYDPTVHTHSALGVRFSDPFHLFQIGFGTPSNPSRDRWSRYFGTSSATYIEDGRRFGEFEPSSSIGDFIRSVPRFTGTTTLSFEINPPREVRGIPLVGGWGISGQFTVHTLDSGARHGTVRGDDSINDGSTGTVVIPYGVTVPFGCDAISPDRCFFSILREGRERQYFTMESGDRRNVEHVMPGVDSYAVIVMGPVRRADTIPGTRPPDGWEDDLCTTVEERTTPVGVDWCKRATINARYNN